MDAPKLFKKFGIWLIGQGHTVSYTSRYIQELNDHCQDIKEELINSGFSNTKASNIAIQRIGSFNALKKNYTAFSKTRFFVKRCPLRAFLLLPFLFLMIQIVSMLALLIIFKSISNTQMKPFSSQLKLLNQIFSIIPSLFILSSYIILLKQTLRSHSSFLFPGLSMLLLIFYQSSFTTAFSLTGQSGKVFFSIGFAFHPASLNTNSFGIVSILSIYFIYLIIMFLVIRTRRKKFTHLT